MKDIFKDIKWDSKYVPKPTMKTTTHSLNMRGLRKVKPDPYLDRLVENEQEDYGTVQDMINVLPLYNRLCADMDKFVDKHCADFDKSILKGTAALSLVPPNHTFLDEFGAFTLTTDSKIPLADPSKYLARYETKIADIRTIKASYPRGKNTGLPIIVSGGNRFTSNVVNVINLITASAIQDWMYQMPYAEFKSRMDNLISWLNTTFGYATSQVVFSRFQHTGKAVPVTFNDARGQWFETTNLFPRRRIVNSTIKYIAMALKAVIKVITEIDLATPAFEQDRPNISKRITTCMNSGGVVLAIDQSRFDLRHGGDKMDHLYDKILKPRFTRIFGKVGEHITHLSLIEASSETLIPTLDGVYAGEGTSVLKSGESATSRKGSYMNLVDDMTITRVSLGLTDEQVNDYFIKHQPSAILGDDLLKLFPSNEDALKYVATLDMIAKDMGIGMEIEKPSKFLGSLIVNANDPFSASPSIKEYFGRKIDSTEWMQPIGSILQKSAFPERFKSERFPTFAFMIKFIVIPFNCINPEDMRKHVSITDSYLADVAKLIHSFGVSRTKYNNKRAKYFLDAATFFPKTREGAYLLYKDLLVNPSKYGLDVNYDFDEILNALFKGLEHDINWSVVGLTLDDTGYVTGNIKEASLELIEGISPNAKASEFIMKLLTNVNAEKDKDLTSIKNLYDTVVRYHKLLGLRYSPGLPVH